MRTKTRGRQSLNGAGDSPQLRVRVSNDLLNALQRQAARQGTTVSEFVRSVLADAAYRSGPASALSHRGLTGPLGMRLRERRAEVLAVAGEHRITNLQVFGSVARGDDGPDSDIDLLAELPGGMGLIGLGRARAELERVLDARVDLIPAADLKPDVVKAVATELVSL